MNRERIEEQMAGNGYVPSRSLVLWCWVGIVLGLAALVIGFTTVSVVETWLWLLLWFLIFGGLAQGILVWSAVFRVAQARWTPAINRIGHSAIGFLPIAFLVMVVLFFGVRYYVPWVTHEVPEKAAWLNVPFMVIRNVVLMAVLTVVSFLLVRLSLAADAIARDGQSVPDNVQSNLTGLGVVLILAYVAAFTILSWDFIMSLSPEWFSTMFAPFYWVTNAYAGLALLVILCAVFRRPLGVVGYIQGPQFADMGNLLLGFSLFSMGLFFAQYLTIWYANIHEETFFLIERYYRGPWPWLGWPGFFVAYAIPFVLLQSRAVKHSPRLLSFVSSMILLGVIIERYVLVVPSVIGTSWVTIAVIPAFSVLAFVGAFILAVVSFLRRYAPIESAQLALSERRELERIIE